MLTKRVCGWQQVASRAAVTTRASRNQPRASALRSPRRAAALQGPEWLRFDWSSNVGYTMVAQWRFSIYDPFAVSAPQRKMDMSGCLWSVKEVATRSRDSRP
jgi:hypothetical protein